MLNRSVACAALTLTTFVLAGCGAWQAASDKTVAAYDTVFHNLGKTVNVDLTAGDSLNQDDAGRSASVAVRVYQLKDRRAFDAASLSDLLKQDATMLAKDQTARMAAVVNPGGSASLSQPMQRDTKFVAIAAFYRSAGKDGIWKQVITSKSLPEDEPLRLTLSDRALTIADNAKSSKK